MIPFGTQNGGTGATPAPYSLGTMAAGARRLAQVGQPAQQPGQAPAQTQDGTGADTASILQQMQASRAVGLNYQQQMAQSAGADGQSSLNEMGAANAATLRDAMQAQAQRMAYFRKASQLGPQGFGRAMHLQQMRDAGMDTDATEAMWAAQDQAATGGPGAQ